MNPKLLRVAVYKIDSRWFAFDFNTGIEVTDDTRENTLLKYIEKVKQYKEICMANGSKEIPYEPPTDILEELSRYFIDKPNSKVTFEFITITI